MNAFDTETTVSAFGSEYAKDLLGVPGKPPLLSWEVSSVRSVSSQKGYVIQAAEDQEFLRLIEEITVHSKESQFVMAPGGNLVSREVRFFRVKVLTDHGWTHWSEALRIEAGLLSPSDFIGVPVGDTSKAEEAVALLRTEFNLSKRIQSARLYATAHGVFNTYINGKRVSDEILAPGWTDYFKRQLIVTHDVTALVVSGKNAWGVELGDGWFRGKLGFVATTNLYGEHTAFLGQLEIHYVDGSEQIISTNNKWKRSTGEIQLASIYDGSTINLNLNQTGWTNPNFNDGEWKFVRTRIMDKSIFEPRASEPVRVIKEFQPELSMHDKNIRVNVNQNISGWLKIKVKGSAGAKLTIKHAEVLERDGKLHTKALRSAKATDVYILSDDKILELEPAFTFHGFQFADIQIDGSARVLEVVAIAISSDVSLRSSFSSSHPGLNKLAQNIYWSFRDNIVSIPTDCPQRDERLGWTGDAQVISYAAHTMVNGYQFFKSWMKDVAKSQLPSGEIPVVIPDIIDLRFPKGIWTSFPNVGWGDAITLIPWSLYERFGDTQILEENVLAMRDWIRCLCDLREGALIPASVKQLGDWLDPDAPPGRPAEAKVSGQFMANAYLAYSALILSRVEHILGNKERSTQAKKLFEDTRDAIWHELAVAARQTPTGAALLLQFELAPAQTQKTISDELSNSVLETEGLIRTGFLGTPLVLDAMSQFGNFDAAYAMLLRTKKRSWLYPISVGATTMWERWDAISEDGSIESGSLENSTTGSGGTMISFNHYAYGAVLDWMYRNVGGLAPLEPGYSAVKVSPRPHKLVTSCSTSIDSGYGEISLVWEVVGNELRCALEVPFGVSAQLDFGLMAGGKIFDSESEILNFTTLSHGKYQLRVKNPSIAG